MTDTAQAQRLITIIQGLDLDSADGRAGVQSILREIEAASPGAIERLAASLQLRRLGLTTTVAH
ncbi:MAG: hypothetical protein U1E18_19230 [Brevundimonas sp.]|uniref:hypothetical protein n=1 Tax=Brevundimonas sp. TaxID=1871086 RepID=UPI002ABCF1B8|nr:hypothetical protein [Brevundimonas sp.]MDZ4111711.1 hypothetical protein [Brevundimonas sp.]